MKQKMLHVTSAKHTTKLTNCLTNAPGTTQRCSTWIVCTVYHTCLWCTSGVLQIKCSKMLLVTLLETMLLSLCGSSSIFNCTWMQEVSVKLSICFRILPYFIHTALLRCSRQVWSALYTLLLLIIKKKNCVLVPTVFILLSKSTLSKTEDLSMLKK